MKDKITDLSSLLNQAVQEKKYLQNEVNKLSLRNMELFEEKERNQLPISEEVQELQIKVKIISIFSLKKLFFS